MTVERWSVRVTGVVQGVGFRPYVHSLASSLGLSGLVGNDDAGVFVEVQGDPEVVRTFVSRLPHDAPPLARVEAVSTAVIDPSPAGGFVIVPSRRSSDAVTIVPPDTAVCRACLSEVLDPADRRHRYPFTACTYCGPRFTIVTGLPYDRPQTTMVGFPLCDECRSEYEDPTNRRFHAQPTACPTCGPSLTFRRPSTAPGEPDPTGDEALAAAIRLLAEGGVLAVKGVGGYHLACDATQPEVVAELRRRKGRGDKPFAVMVADLPAAEQLVVLTHAAREVLASPEAPIVLATVADDHLAREVAAAAAPGNGQLGTMLAYSPLHHLLLRPHPSLGGVRLTTLVMTSGNRSDEPLCTAPDEAERRLDGLADAWLHHDRPIHVPCDDSVVRVTGERLLPIRRSRGYAPLPVRLPMTAPDVLAVGGELKTTLCLGAGARAWLSQHVGDTEHLETLDLLSRTADTLCRLSGVAPAVVVADTHPGYLSRRWATERAAATGVPLVGVQHHHAHLASLLAEQGVPVGEQVLGFAFDGTGFGDDGTIWGGELLLGDYAAVARVGHLRPISLPGGDAAIRRPARSAMAHLTAAGLSWEPSLAPVAAADDVERRVLSRMLATGSGCTPTTSMGRLFDAVSSLLGVCQDADFEGQAAMALESLAAVSAPGVDDAARWAWSITGAGTAEEPLVLDPAPALTAGVAAVRDGVGPAVSAVAFHDSVADAVLRSALAVRDRHGVRTIGLTGGVFQNVLLTESCVARLEREAFIVLTHHVVPPNDGGLALGQVAVAAARAGR